MLYYDDNNQNINNYPVANINNFAIGENKKIRVSKVEKLHDIIEYKSNNDKIHINFPSSGIQFKAGSLNLFNPLYKYQRQCVFSQLGIQRVDKRNLINIGIGHRHYFDYWILGLNSFYDMEVFGNNCKRLGIGSEFLQDFLHFTMNGYFSLTGWRSLYNKSEHEMRVLHGYDIGIRTWLPFFPQFNGKVKFEKLFCEKKSRISEVRVGCEDQLMLIIGVDYNPIPMLTLSIDNIFYGLGHSKDTKFNLSANYQFHKPLYLKSCSTYSTEELQRKIINSLYCFVDRDNKLPIATRLKSKMNFKLLSNEILGYSGEIKIINYTVKSDHKFKSVAWDYLLLQNQGGKIVLLDPDPDVFAICFPLYNRTGINKFTIVGVAYDVLGNTSTKEECSVVVREFFSLEPHNNFMCDIPSLSLQSLDSSTFISMHEKNLIDVMTKVHRSHVNNICMRHDDTPQNSDLVINCPVNDQNLISTLEIASSSSNIHASTSLSKPEPVILQAATTPPPPPPPLPAPSFLAEKSSIVISRSKIGRNVSMSGNESSYAKCSAFGIGIIEDIKNNQKQKFLSVGSQKHLEKLENIISQRKQAKYTSDLTNIFLKIVKNRNISSSSDSDSDTNYQE